jgi:hypothetical protein
VRAIQDEARSKQPALEDTVPDAVGNILLDARDTVFVMFTGRI